MRHAWKGDTSFKGTDLSAPSVCFLFCVVGPTYHVVHITTELTAFYEDFSYACHLNIEYNANKKWILQYILAYREESLK